MNHKPDSVMAIAIRGGHLSGTDVTGRLHAVYPRLTGGPPARKALLSLHCLTLLPMRFAVRRRCRRRGGLLPRHFTLSFRFESERRYPFCCAVC